jgi:hypothetical protein
MQPKKWMSRHLADIDEKLKHIKEELQRGKEDEEAKKALENQQTVLNKRKSMLIKTTPSITLPTIWLGNSSGIRNFVCDGLGSILPRDASRRSRNASPDTSTDQREGETNGSLGYSWAVGKLEEAKRIQWEPPEDITNVDTENDVVLAVRRLAHIRDIQAG